MKFFLIILIQVSAIFNKSGILAISFYIALVFSCFYALWRVAIPSTAELKNRNKSMENRSKSDNANSEINNDTTTNENDNNENKNCNDLNNGKQSDYETAWKITADHCILSLVWMIVPFIPASGKI